MRQLTLITFALLVMTIMAGCCNTNTASYTPSKAIYCSVSKTGATTTITCPDGTVTTVTDGQDGSTGPQGGNGTPGRDGHSALISSNVADVSLCVNGGQAFTMGTDLNDNSVLDVNEVTSTAVLCNGANGQNAPPTAFTPVALVEPCAHDPNNPSQDDLNNANLEIFFKMSSGLLISSVSSNANGDNTHLGVVTPGVMWQSTGISSNCYFTVDSAGTITQH